MSRLLRLLALPAFLVASPAGAQIPIAAPEPDAPITEPAAPATTGGTPPTETPPTAPPPASTPPPAPTPSEASAPRPTAIPKSQAVRTTPEKTKSKRRLNWTYPRFRWWEYVAAGAVAVGNITMEVAYQAQPKDRWRDPILFDGPVRSAFKGNKRVSEIAGHVGDWTWYGVQNFVLLDGIVTPLVSDKFNTDVALQLTMMNWQAVGLTGLIARTAHVTVGRTRPSLQGCSNEEGAENKCEFRGASFFSGHAAMTTASAVLGCLNHKYLPLYGGTIADDLVCPVLLTGAATVGVSRIVNDKHWISDVLVGWAVGGLIGYGLPYGLHYAPSAVKVALQPTPRTAIVPWADEVSGGLRFVGTL